MPLNFKSICTYSPVPKCSVANSNSNCSKMRIEPERLSHHFTKTWTVGKEIQIFFTWTMNRDIQSTFFLTELIHTFPLLTHNHTYLVLQNIKLAVCIRRGYLHFLNTWVLLCSVDSTCHGDQCSADWLPEFTPELIVISPLRSVSPM